MTSAYQYSFSQSVSLEDVESSLLLAVFATGSVHGEAQMLLDASHSFDPVARTLVIDATTEVGRDLNRIFAGFLRREFGAGTFSVTRLPQCDVNPAAA
jgi:hypothetical protein